MPVLRAVGLWVCLVIAACDSGPPPSVPPQSPPPLDTARYPNATLLIDGVDPDQETVVLTQGQACEYSGSFELADPEPEPSRLASLVFVRFLVDLEQSGYEEGPPLSTGEPATEVIVGEAGRPVVTLDAENTVRFHGQFEAPRKTGAVEMRVTLRDGEDILNVTSRRIEIVAGEDEESSDGNDS